MKFVPFVFLPSLVGAALPPGPGPFGNEIIAQPVPGALEFVNPKVCEVNPSHNNSNATNAIQSAIDKCGDLAGGGVVLIESSLVLYTASLWLKSNLTLRVAGKLVGTATGYGNKTDPTNTNATDAPVVYTRRNSEMMWAHAGLVNGGRCVRLKDPLAGWDDCAEWSVLENVVLDGGGTLDANAQGWFLDGQDDFESAWRPMMLDLLWVRGLTIRDLEITRPGYWTVHPTFSDNVRVENNSIITTGSNTDGCDPDSCWNVYIARNTFDNGDDCIAIKAGRDWSGLMVNISTRNVLAEQNYYLKGHGVSIGSETSGWVTNVTIRDSELDGTAKAVRIKSMRGRGGGVADVVYRNLTGVVEDAISLSLNYHEADPTNDTATPEIRDVVVADLDLRVTDDGSGTRALYSSSNYMECLGLNDSIISNIAFANVKVALDASDADDLDASCQYCTGIYDDDTDPSPCFNATSFSSFSTSSS
ncbi:hypothetical protein CTAYLR_007773 [Chrysophaeum taylorii]|uniref:Polygalacturonase n=1 Tax=Chrysophaeum taylorii TaxID=2483200 RepID=A0AAD7UL70_9STRA|nr:hypothetical protein CTAYLR_007773 [Chrysophaeum taylorii]